MAKRSSYLLSERDSAVIELVGTFKQLTAQQLGTLAFTDLTSNTPRDRTLKRLVERGYLARLARRPPGGDGGGSAQYIYQLGRKGWRHLELPGKYRVYRSASDHIIELADLYVMLKAAERADAIEVIRFDREQNSWMDVGSVRLTPDAYLEVGSRATRTKVGHFVELDRGTERAAKIREKCTRYWQAYQHWEASTFPYVLFVVPDERRKREIVSVVEGGPTEARGLFRACISGAVVELLLESTSRMCGAVPD